MNQIEKIQARKAGGGLQIFPGAAGKVEHLMLCVDDHVGRRVAIGDLVGALAYRGSKPGQANRRSDLLDRGFAGVACHERELGQDLGRCLHAAEQPVLAIDRDEKLMPGDVLGCAEEQQSARTKREVEDRDHPVLQVAVQVDEQVPARQQVDTREWRILDQVVGGEDAHLAQLLRHSVRVTLPHEPAGQPFLRHMIGDGA